MTSEVKDILVRAYECKIKSKINIQQFLQIVNSDANLNKISEKGLFILYLCEILLKAYLAQGLKIRNFIAQFDKKQVKKRQRREGGGQTRRRRRPKNQNKRGQGRTLQQISDQSLSNPSNIERPRTDAQNVRVDSSSGNKNLPSKQKDQESNAGSKDSSRNNNPLKIQLSKITQQIRHQQTHITDIQFAPIQLQDNSQTSSSHQTGEISNLSQKIKIFTSIKQSQRHGNTTRRKTGNNNISRDTRTKKKKFDIIDQSTFIQETRATDNQITINYTQISRFDNKDAIDMDLMNNFLINLGKEQKLTSIQFFQKDKLDIVRHVFNNQIPHHRDINNSFGIIQMNQDFDNTQFPDYTMSQPTTAPLFQPDFFKQSLQIKQSQFNFDDLLKHSNKDKATLLYQLLWREQNDEIRMSQQKPQMFGMIKVRHK